MFTVKRNPHNPILMPYETLHWASVAVYNWCPVFVNNKKHVLYRAMAKPDYLHGPNVSLSTIGIADTNDNIHYYNHRQLIIPENEWEMYGCEDPRATIIGDKIYIFYTALSNYPFNHEGIKSAIAITDLDFNILEKKLVTPFNSKAITLFSEKVNGKYVALITVHPDIPPSSICIAEFDQIEDMWNMDYWREWYSNYKDHEFKIEMKSDEHIEIGSAPIKTERGWLLIYSHIQNYFTDNDKIFGIRAMILNINDLRKVVGITDYAFMVPETHYEKTGLVPNIVFPSGAEVTHDRKLNIYYGGADTVCCEATTNIDHFLDSIGEKSYVEAVTRYQNNPILTPKAGNSWESKAVFNPGVIEIDGKIHIVYRAMSEDNTSTMGYASTTDGYNIDERLDAPIYVPRADFENKLSHPDGNSGCEDPRLVLIDDTVYMLYTAYNGVNPPSVAATSISKQDFVNHKWNWAEPHLISPEGFDDKDACIFPEKINESYVFIHRLKSVICIDYVDSLDFEKDKLDRCIYLIGPRHGMWDGLKVGISGPPMKTPHGWLLMYHGVSTDSVYRVGATLLDLDNPANVIGRSSDYIFEPKEDYEKYGQVNNVVFPCGMALRNGKLLMYYGGGDSVIGIAEVDFEKLIDSLLV